MLLGALLGALLVLKVATWTALAVASAVLAVVGGGAHLIRDQGEKRTVITSPSAST
jgi:hypothetical protein